MYRRVGVSAYRSVGLSAYRVDPFVRQHVYFTKIIGGFMRSKVETYEDLEVWKRSMDLVEGIYRLTDEFPKTETYGLVAQMRRCAISIPSNIAEGKRRFGNREFRRFAGIAFGSGAELETQIKIAKRLQFVCQSLLWGFSIPTTRAFCTSFRLS